MVARWWVVLAGLSACASVGPKAGTTAVGLSVAPAPVPDAPGDAITESVGPLLRTEVWSMVDESFPLPDTMTLHTPDGTVVLPCRPLRWPAGTEVCTPWRGWHRGVGAYRLEIEGPTGPLAAEFELDGSEWSVTVSMRMDELRAEVSAWVVRPSRAVGLVLAEGARVHSPVELVNLSPEPLTLVGLYGGSVDGIVVRLEAGDARTYGLPSPGCGFGYTQFELAPGDAVPVRFATGVLGGGHHEARFRFWITNTVAEEARVRFDVPGEPSEPSEEWGEMTFTEPTLNVNGAAPHRSAGS